MDADRLLRIRAGLLARRKTLLDAYDRRRAQGEEASAPEPRDEADESVRLEAQDEAFRMAAAESRELVQIDAALARMAEATFGECIECGDEIEEKRILALPTASRCLACQEAAEPWDRRRRRETGAIPGISLAPSPTMEAWSHEG